MIRGIARSLCGGGFAVLLLVLLPACDELIGVDMGGGGGGPSHIDIPLGPPEEGVPETQTYRVSVQQPIAHGRVEIQQSGSSLWYTELLGVQAGTIVLVLAMPDSRYHVKPGTVKYNGVPADWLFLDEYAFVMPQNNAAVTAEFEIDSSHAAALHEAAPPAPPSTGNPADPVGVNNSSPHVRILQYAHGAIEVFPPKQTMGDPVRLTVNAENGWRYKSNSLTLTPPQIWSGSGPFTFTMPNEDITNIQAEFVREYAVVEDVNATPGPVITASPARAVPYEPISLQVSLPPGWTLIGFDPVPLRGGGQAVITGSGNTWTFTPTDEPVNLAAYQVSANLVQNITSYTVTVSPSANGAVSASHATALVGETVTLTVSPDSGYRLQPGGLQVNGDSTVVSGAGPYTFTMPASNVTVTAAFEPVNTSHIVITFDRGSKDETINLSGPGSAPLSLNYQITLSVTGGFTVLRWLFDGEDKTADITALSGGGPVPNSFTARLESLAWQYNWRLTQGIHSITAIVYPTGQPVPNGQGTGTPVYSKTITFRIQ